METQNCKLEVKISVARKVKFVGEPRSFFESFERHEARVLWRVLLN
jgi:hypothetical protein